MRVIYPGSFDPLHLGHIDVITQAHELFGEVVVAVLHNHAKISGLLPVAQRIELAREALEHLPGTVVEAHTGLAVQAAEAAGAAFIVKGLRNSEDFEIEHQMAHNNFATAGVRTVYLPGAAGLGFISSRFVRELAKYGAEIGHLVPTNIASALRTVFAEDDAEKLSR